MTLPDVAQEAMERFYARHPDWRARFGEAGFRRAVEDSQFHLRFLGSAVELGSPYAFGDYVAWVRTVLGSRGIAVQYLAETLEDLAAILEGRLPPTEVARLTAYFAEALRVCREPIPVHPEVSPTPFLQALLLGDREAAATIVLEQMRAGGSLLEIYQDVIVASIELVGQLWQTNRISVGDEHTATEVIKHVTARLYSEAGGPPPVVRGKAVLTGVQGEHHQLGARLVADLWELEGLKVRYLGTDLPTQTILDVIEKERPRLVGVSITLPASLHEAVRLIGGIRRRWSERELPIVIGGRGFEHVPPVFFETHGVQARAADLQQAVSLVKSF